MESLPELWLVQNRQFLRRLWISEAKSLKCLPVSIQELSLLEDLYIDDCHSELLNEMRENSNSVSHIRRVEIVKSLRRQTRGDWFSIMGKECDVQTYRRLRGEDMDVIISWVNQPNDDEGVESSEPWWTKYQCCLKNAS